MQAQALLEGSPQDNLRALHESQMRLTEAYSKQLSAVETAYRERYGETPTLNLLRNTAQLLENTQRYIKINESTKNSALSPSFADYGLDIVTGIAPNFIANELFSVQALNARKATVFYLDYLYGTNKGQISQGDVMRRPESGSTSNFNYSGERVDGEVLGTGNGVATTFNTTLAYFPVRQIDSVMKIFDAGTEVGQINAAGAFSGAALTPGGCSINFVTGAITVEFAAAPANGNSISFVYEYDMYETTVGIPEVNIDIREKYIEARPRKLRANWSLDTAFAFEKEHGKPLDAELLMATGSEVRHEIDGSLIADCYQKAGLTGYSFNMYHAKDPAVSRYGVRDHYDTFGDLINEINNDIFKASKRTQGNWLVVGKNGAMVLEGMSSENFEKASNLAKNINGPHFFGTLNKTIKCYKNPYFADTQFLLGSKGANPLDSGYTFAPFMPMFTLPPITLDDFVQRTGVATSYGQLMTDNSVFAKGTITNTAP